MKYVLKTFDIKKQYKNSKVLNGINMNIEIGAIYGLIGKNGAGKTTLIRIICGLQKPTSGTYSIYDISNNDTDINLSRNRMGAIIETPAIYQNLSAKDNLLVQNKLIGASSNDNINELLKLVGLENTNQKKVKDFSLGMKQRLGIALSLASNPDFLILDEPINGLDPEGIIEIRELILKLNKEKRITILISSHYLDELSKIATHYGFLNNGLIIKEISNVNLLKKMENKLILTVSNLKEFVTYFEENKISYEVIDNKTINVYGNYNLSKFMNNLLKQNLFIEDIKKEEETLESYYMNLIGGNNNA